MSERACQHCGERFDVAEGRPGSGHLRRYCSANCRKRACDTRTGRADCVDCGKQRGPNSRWSVTGRCWACYLAASPVHDRDRELERLWADGKTLRQIAERFGWTIDHLRVYMVRARGRGANLPYRYTTGKRAGSKFPEQVPA